MNFGLAIPHCPSMVLSVRTMPEYLFKTYFGCLFLLGFGLDCLGFFFLFLLAVTRSESPSALSPPGQVLTVG